MKFPYWRDPNVEIEIIEMAPEALDKYGHNYGSDIIKLTQEHIDAIKEGKALAWNDGEYSTFVFFYDELDATTD